MLIYFKYILVIISIPILVSISHGQVQPLLGTNWRQGGPYNAALPEWCSEAGQICSPPLAGCTTIALSQIAYYYQYPNDVVPPSENPISYTIRMDDEGGRSKNISLDVDTAEVVWGCGTMQYGQVAKLVRTIGIMLNSEFNFKNTTSNVFRAKRVLRDRLGYTEVVGPIFNCESILQPWLCPSYTTSSEEFLEIIKNELNADKVVYFAAEDPVKKMAHAMIIDGYDEFDRIHINFGWQGEANGYYHIDDIRTEIYASEGSNIDYSFNDNQHILVGISPPIPNWQENVCQDQWVGENIISNIVSRSSYYECPELIYPQPYQHGVSNRVYWRWSEVADASYYILSVKSVGAQDVYVDSLKIYGGYTSYTDLTILPENDTIEVMISAVNSQAEISDCTPYVYYTDTTNCAIRILDYEQTCLSDSTYSLQIEISGLQGHTYDLWVEDTTGVLMSFNSVAQGEYVFGPISTSASIAAVVEDEAQPYDCYHGVGVERIRCVFCPEIGLSITSNYCLADSISLNVNLEVDTSTIIDLYTTIEGVNTFNNEGSGDYTFNNIPSGEEFLVIAEDTSKPYDCNRIIFVEALQCNGDSTETGIQTLEYFIDTDPGYGSGSIIPTPSSYNLVINHAINLDTLSPGVHILYIRAMDELGLWGYTVRKLFYIRPEPEGQNRLLTNLEYFIDADPGPGLGIPLTLENNTNSIDSYLLPLDTIDPGIHVLYVRGKDNIGNWSFTQRKLFYIRPGDETSNRLLTNLEYFIDTDPGSGMGIPLTLGNDTNSIDSYLLPLATINPGIHVLYVRGKDNAGNWSYTSRKLFYIRPGSETSNRLLTDLEYFIDTDPGFGLGIPLQLDNDTNSIALYDIALDTFTPGLHHLYVRGKDNQGDWGYTIVKPFTIYILGPIVYVDWDAMGANIGTSWTNAYTRLEPALMLATLYDTIQEIWIAQGLYKPTSTSDRNSSFTWADSTKLYGGFTGTETTRNQRTSDPTLVVLSGDIGISNDSTDNTYHVVVIDSTCQGCYLDRLTIKLGHASGSIYSRDKGAGIHSLGNAEIKDVVVEYNSAASTGAAIYNIGSGADLRMMNCIFRFNNSPNGYDVHNADGATIEIQSDVQIED